MYFNAKKDTGLKAKNSILTALVLIWSFITGNAATESTPVVVTRLTPRPELSQDHFVTWVCNLCVRTGFLEENLGPEYRNKVMRMHAYRTIISRCKPGFTKKQIIEVLNEHGFNKKADASKALVDHPCSKEIPLEDLPVDDLIAHLAAVIENVRTVDHIISSVLGLHIRDYCKSHKVLFKDIAVTLREISACLIPDYDFYPEYGAEACRKKARIVRDGIKESAVKIFSMALKGSNDRVEGLRDDVKTVVMINSFLICAQAYNENFFLSEGVADELVDYVARNFFEGDIVALYEDLTRGLGERFYGRAYLLDIPEKIENLAMNYLFNSCLPLKSSSAAAGGGGCR